MSDTLLEHVFSGVSFPRLDATDGIDFFNLA